MESFQLVIFIGLILATLVRICYWLYFFRRFPIDSKFGPSLIDEGVSVLVCVKNGAKDLARNLPLILAQDYPIFEILIVDDFSDDVRELRTFVDGLGNPNVKVVRSKENIFGKKKAVETGVNSAKFDLILVTDVDCKPNSTSWISTMVDALKSDGEIVLGYGQLEDKGGLLGKFIRFETIWTAMQYFSYASVNQSYMGVGRNMLYRKDTFLKLDPYHDNYDTPGGDDDVFVSKASALGKSIKTCVDRKAWTVSQPKEDWKSYMSQKMRHVSSSVNYSGRIKFLLLLFALSHILFYVFALWCLGLGLVLPVFGVMACFYLVCGLIHSTIFTQLDGNNLKLAWPFFDFIFAMYLLVMGCISPFYNRKW